ncbi:MAG: M3 family metallopeptidase [Planctomycetaceae bacterium]|nr:M3 family metallopeptidase [Planctomycetaceae bacterium]
MSQDDNPFFKVSSLPFHTPAFDQIRDEHYLPAFEEGMQRQLEEIRAIAEQSDAPTFENTLTAMEKTGDLLTRVRIVFFNQTSAHTNPKIQEIQAQIAPRLAAHSDDILLNAKLFARVKTLYDSRDTLNLTEEQREVLRHQYEAFVRAGAQLTEQQKQRIREINEEQSSLETQFEDNLLAVTKERAVLVSDVAELDGMNESSIAAAAQAAEQSGHTGQYQLNITNTTRQPILVSLKNRDVRRRVWEASAFRGLGQNGGIDNRPLVLKLAKLRAERAALLGFPNHAAYRLQPQMARTPDAARRMLTEMVPGVLAKVKEEAAELTAEMRKDGITDELQPWDWEYYAERVRQAKYDVDADAVKPYFELDTVLKNGVFHTMNRLFGVEFRERKDLPVYHPEVRVFDVIDHNGEQIGLFYVDYIRRDSKRGGAWMSSYVDQSHLLHEKPVIVNVMNIEPPAEGQPVLMTFDNVTTMFHEMGHGVHGLFSDVTYPSVSGTEVPRDFVEFPSTFQEDWAIRPDVLANYARHYRTGEPIPDDLLDKVIRASKFNQGFDTMEYVSAALLDLEWHSLSVDEIPDDVEAFEAAALKKLGLDYAPVPPRYRTQFFAHVWPGGYSSSYYAYMWSEVLAADAFAYMVSRGGVTRENGQRFRDTILSRGGSREPMKSYVDFRGQEPTVDALLIRRGLKQAAGQ